MIHIYNDVVPGYNSEIDQAIPGIEPYLAESKDNKKMPALILCQGGAYTHKAQHEGEPIAKYFKMMKL